MHNYVHSAAAFERQRREEARRGAGEGQREARGRIGLIVSRAERRQYRCPSYNQQRATRQEEKKTQNKTVKKKKVKTRFASDAAKLLLKHSQETDAQQHRCMFADGLLLSFFLFFLSLTKRRQNKQTQND